MKMDRSNRICRVTLAVLFSASILNAVEYVVNHSADGTPPFGKLNLRAAVNLANANPGLDTIRLAVSELTINLHPSGEDLNQGGDFDIRDSLRIWTSVETCRINCASIDRAFDVHKDTLQLDERIQIENGKAPDGNAGTVGEDGADGNGGLPGSPGGNAQPGGKGGDGESGGGVRVVFGALLANGVSFINCRAGNGGNGGAGGTGGAGTFLFRDGAGGDGGEGGNGGHGGAVSAELSGRFVIIDCQFVDCQAGSGGRGGDGGRGGSRMLFESAGGDGGQGGPAGQGGGASSLNACEIRSCTFENCRSLAGGKGGDGADGEFPGDGGSGGDAGWGGSISIAGGDIRKSSVSDSSLGVGGNGGRGGNSTLDQDGGNGGRGGFGGWGGGIYANKSRLISCDVLGTVIHEAGTPGSGGSSISGQPGSTPPPRGNGSGGGYYVDWDSSLEKCLAAYCNTKGGQGGGVFAGINGTVSEMDQCILFNNQAATGAGVVSTKLLRMVGCTIYGNHGTEGDFTGGGLHSFNRPVLVSHSYFSHNDALEIGGMGATSQGYNLVQDTGIVMGLLGSDIQADETLQVVMGNNDFERPVTLIPQPNSQAINAGTAAGPGAAPGDYRDGFRVIGNASDIGAVEVNQPSLRVTQLLEPDTLNIRAAFNLSASYDCTLEVYKLTLETGQTQWLGQQDVTGPDFTVPFAHPGTEFGIIFGRAIPR